MMKIRDIVVAILLPLSACCSILLTLLVVLSPNLAFSGQTFLAAVLPSNNADSSRVVMGIVGSCSKIHKTDAFNCTRASVAPKYDLSVLPPNAPTFLLDEPPVETFGMIVLGLLFAAGFCVMFSITAAASTAPLRKDATQRPFWLNITTVLGLLGFLFGFTSFFVLRIYLGKSVDDFNNTITFQGSDAPPLVATIGNGFIITWVAYGFLGVPLFACLAKLHVFQPKPRKAASNNV